MSKVRVRISDHALAIGERANCVSCPVALQLSWDFPIREDVPYSVSKENIEVVVCFPYIRIPTPPAAQRIINAIDYLEEPPVKCFWIDLSPLLPYADRGKPNRWNEVKA